MATAHEMPLPAAAEAKPVRRRARCTAEVRRRAILDAAIAVFLERGFAGATVDAVVERAGGSKATVYAMFGNKEGLLAVLVAEGVESLAESLDTAHVDAPIAESLRRIGLNYLHLIIDPKRVALFRLVVGESGRFPQLGDIFYRTGPETAVRKLAEFFRAAAARGLIAAPEPERLAVYFLDLMRGDLHLRAILNATRRPTEKELERHLDFVLPRFLAGCGVPAPARA